MISLPFSRLEHHEIEDAISRIPDIWKKHRGFAWWGVGLEQLSTIHRQFELQSLSIFEFQFTRARGTPSLVAIFLVDQDSNESQVLLYAPRILEQKVKNTFLQAFKEFEDAYHYMGNE